MNTLNNHIIEYKKQQQKGDIVLAYRGIMDFMWSLKNYFSSKHTEFSVSGNLYQGYMDMSYFAIVPDILKKKKLKIALVFIHPEIKFEVWLSGANKKVQQEYRRKIINAGWNKYRIPKNQPGVDSIIEYDLIKDPDFEDQKKLMQMIEEDVLKFIGDVERFIISDT